MCPKYSGSLFDRRSGIDAKPPGWSQIPAPEAKISDDVERLEPNFGTMKPMCRTPPAPVLGIAHDQVGFVIAGCQDDSLLVSGLSFFGFDQFLRRCSSGNDVFKEINATVGSVQDATGNIHGCYLHSATVPK
jgi:hypothetical protein